MSDKNSETEKGLSTEELDEVSGGASGLGSGKQTISWGGGVGDATPETNG